MVQMRGHQRAPRGEDDGTAEEVSEGTAEGEPEGADDGMVGGNREVACSRISRVEGAGPRERQKGQHQWQRSGFDDGSAKGIGKGSLNGPDDGSEGGSLDGSGEWFQRGLIQRVL